MEPTATLSPKKRRFVAGMVKHGNATQAAKDAGYSAKTASVAGCRLLRNVQIRAAIDAATVKVEQRAEISAAYVLNSLKEIAERCQQRVPVMVREGRHMVQATAAGADGVELGVWEFDSSGANRSLELLGKHLKLFTDKVELSGSLTLEQLVEGKDPDAGA